MNRRDFIKTGCTACISFTAAASVLQSCTATRYSNGEIVKDGLNVSKDAFRISQNGNTAYRSFVIINNEQLKYPICLYRFSDTEYSALWMQCTHQGGELQASGDVLQCPAHGSEFSNRGKVISGPADMQLRSFPITINDDHLFIDLRKQS